MTFSLDNLNSGTAKTATAEGSSRSRFAAELALICQCVAMVLWLLALLSYSPQDGAWSTSGVTEVIHNRAGLLGAGLADACYFLFGFSVWWCVLAAARAWLRSFAAWLRSRDLM